MCVGGGVKDQNLAGPHLRVRETIGVMMNRCSEGPVESSNVHQSCTFPALSFPKPRCCLCGPLVLQGEVTGAGPGRDPTPKGGGGGGLYGPQNCRTEQCALSAPEAPQILF